MDNMMIWGKVCNTPKEARKPIQAGRLKGMTDINPMWRFKVLTEAFGPCGIGWKYQIVNKWIESGMQNEVKAFVEINLYIRDPETKEWSEAIPGVGGSSFVTVERNGPYCSDECYKMALTDAISVSCKALGMSADIYFEKDRDKYTAGDGGDGGRRTEPQEDRRAANDRPYSGGPGSQTRMDAPETAKCRHCGKDTPKNELEYSVKMYKQPFCRACQAEYRAYLEKNRQDKEA